MATQAEVKTRLADLAEARARAEREWENRRQEVEREAREAADKARAEVTARHRDEMLRLQHAKTTARAAWQAELDATATHGWEGKKVARQKNVSRGYTARYEPVFGVVEVRRSTTDFPENSASYGLPAMGEAFVRLLNKAGLPGKRFERLYSHSGWKLAE